MFNLANQKSLKIHRDERRQQTTLKSIGIKKDKNKQTKKSANTYK
jgi:hypothetical protein